MSKTKNHVEIEAVDKTAAGFKSISGRAKGVASKVTGVIGGALAAAGAYLGARAIAAGVKELGDLSDIAQKTSTNVGELTQTTTALSVVGIRNMGVDQFAKSLDYMQKATGRAGMEGFYQTIEELGKIPDAAKRSQEAMRAFGRSGMEFMPLINAAGEGTAAIRAVAAAMPMIPQSAADAGDAASDAMGIATNGIKSIWLQGIAAICNWVGELFPGGIREAAARAAAWMEFYAKKMTLAVQGVFAKIQSYTRVAGSFWGNFAGSIYEGASISDAWKYASDQATFERGAEDELLDKMDREHAARLEKWKAAYDEKLKAIAQLGEAYANATKTGKERLELDMGGSAQFSAKIRNSLIYGGSNEAQKLAIFGPDMKNESVKQTALLTRIAANTRKAAEKKSESLEVIE